MSCQEESYQSYYVVVMLHIIWQSLLLSECILTGWGIARQQTNMFKSQQSAIVSNLHVNKHTPAESSTARQLRRSVTWGWRSASEHKDGLTSLLNSSVLPTQSNYSASHGRRGFCILLCQRDLLQEKKSVNQDFSFPFRLPTTVLVSEDAFSLQQNKSTYTFQGGRYVSC